MVAIPLALAGRPLLPLIYGTAFHGAIVPALILLAGLLGDVSANLIGAYLFGVGRPGWNSLAIGAGVVITVVGDLLLIPPLRRDRCRDRVVRGLPHHRHRAFRLLPGITCRAPAAVTQEIRPTHEALGA